MSEDGEAQRTRTATLALVGLLVATLAVYMPALGASFINYDDFEYITKNPVVPEGITVHGLRWAFTTGHMANWHPLAWVSHMADASMFGLNPTGHHLTSVLIHAVNTLLVARLVFEMTQARWRSVIVAALFGLHPFHVESVAWVAERKDVLCMMFCLLAGIMWARWTRSRLRLHYGAAVFLFACALASKPMAVTFPCVLLLFDVWPLDRLRDEPLRIAARRRVVEKLPFFALSVLSSVVTYIVQRDGGAMYASEALPLGPRVANAFVAYARYAGKMIAPVDLALVYPFPVGGWPTWAVLGAVLCFVAISFGTIRELRRQPWLFVGWFFFVGALVPTIGLVQVGVQSMADRYSYLPSLGLLMGGVWAVGELVEKWRVTKAAAIATALLCATYGALTFRQAGYFENGITVFRHAIAVTSPNVIANARLGSALSKEGKREEAESAYRAAIAISPTNAIAQAELGGLLLQMGKVDEAFAHAREAVRLAPDLDIAHYNLGLVHLRRREVAPAIAHLQTAVALAPRSPEPHIGLGLALTEANRFDAAIAELEIATQLSPHGAEAAQDGMAVALARAGRIGEAVVLFQAIVARDPSRAFAHANLGNALVDERRVDEGIAELELAVRLEPGNAMSHYGLASALWSRGRAPEAVAHYREAARLDPTNQDVQRELATALQGAPQ